MGRFKSVGDLDDSPAAVGGAIGSWPLRTLWWLCRWERTGQTDPGAAAALQERNVSQLRQLLYHVEDNFDIDTGTLEARKDALEAADVADMRRALASAYEAEYSSVVKCPFEQEGRDIACHRCPVAAVALDELMDDGR
jgi:hypothetical protein